MLRWLLPKDAPPLPVGPSSYSPEQEKLKFLFSAVLKDGTSIEQTSADLSVVDSKRSRFYDLCEHEPSGESKVDERGRCVVRSDIARFGLSDGVSVYVVDLTDGHFEIKQIDPRLPEYAFRLEPSIERMPAGGIYRLVYWRDVDRDVHQSVVVQYDLSIKAMPTVAGEVRRAYRFGWEYTLGDRRWEQTLIVR